MYKSSIQKVYGRRVWDSRGRPTVEAEIRLENGGYGRAIAPAGASTGSGEALDLRDGGVCFGGLGVATAVNNVNTKIADAIIGMDAMDQLTIDQRLVELDGTPKRSRLGGNAMIAVSMAVAWAAAGGRNLPLWRHLCGKDDVVLPTPEVQIFGGGAHAEGKLDLQDFMVVPFGAGSFTEAMEWVAEIYRLAGARMRQLGQSYGVADEGGYWPAFDSNESAIKTLAGIITDAGFDYATQVGISLDIAASQFYVDGGYRLGKEKRIVDSDQWGEILQGWIEDYPIIAIEDPFVEHDFQSHARLLEAVGDSVQLVGDDLLVTDVTRVQQAVDSGACNTLLCKPNQAGTLSEAKAAYTAARNAGWQTIISARSGETEDVSIVHLALGWGIRQLKVGSFARSERMAKWNEAIRLEDDLGPDCSYAGGLPYGR